MSDSKEKLQSVMVAGATMLGAFVARKLIEKVWEKVTHEPPPSDPADRNISWKEALVWAVATGVLVGVTNVLISRTVTEGTEKLLEK